jgi:hypothetical protein
VPKPDPAVDDDERIADYEGEWTGFGDVPGSDGYPATDCWGEPLPDQPDDQRWAQHQRVQASLQRAVEVHERHPYLQHLFQYALALHQLGAALVPSAFRAGDAADTPCPPSYREELARHLATAPEGVVRVVVPLSTLAGRDHLPAELDGFGPILGDLARRIASDPTGDLQWRASVIDEHGELVADAHLKRQPNLTQVNHVKARDRTCRWPHCTRPAMQADLDHTIAVADGGLTLTQNLGAYCRMHHVAKHNAGWMVTQPVPGTFVHTSLLGQTYVRRQYHPQAPPPEIDIPAEDDIPPF